jgi:cadmium resistance protein CadD (predicted permease)
MTDIIGLLVAGITAFVASNIDDTFVLIVLFLTPNLLPHHVITGQFVGIALLVLISSLASLLALAIPVFAIGLMGLIPIIIGIKKLSDLNEEPETKEQNIKKVSTSILSVAAITISNGGDDIGAFTPLFAKYNTVNEVSITVILFMIMTIIWCVVTYYFIRHPIIASHVSPISRIISPFALIGLGIYIIFDSFVFSF